MNTSQGISYASHDLDNTKLIELYERMLYPRMVEEKMLKLLRQGKISKWFSGIGQEAIAIGATMALNNDEYIFPMHRNLGVFTARDIPLWRLIAQWQGKKDGFTKGRDRSFHFGTQEYKIVGMISHLGPQLSLATGVGLAHKLSQESRVSLAFTGEGATSEGEFHEALNVASVWDTPTIFLIENNGYGLSTPINEQYNADHLVDKAKGYGMEGVRIDGNNILEVYQTISSIADSLRENPRPYLIECDTFRMRGHEEASGVKYVPPELFEMWEKKDPITNFEKHLISEGVITQEYVDKLKQENKQTIESHVKKGFESEEIEVDLQQELSDVYAPHHQEVISPDYNTAEEKRFIDGLIDGLDIAMEKYDDLIIMGQDVAEYGGAFKITDGFVEKYGKDRIRNTPICESAIVGIALGLSIYGRKSIVEMQFADFATCGFNQIVNNLAKSHYRWGQNADVVVRMPTGGGMGAGPFHSQSNEAWFTHTPGLKVVYPSTPEDAKGLLLASIEDPNPVIFFEHKGLYRSLSGNIPQGYYTTEIGKARMVRTGSLATIITYGQGVIWAENYVNETNQDIEIIDLRTLAPLDFETIEQSIQKTSRALVLHEDTATGGIGADIAAMIAEQCFRYLDAPIMRVSSLDTAIPFNQELEKQFMASARLSETIEKLLKF